MGVGKLCIHCRAPACNQKCAEELMTGSNSVCKSTEAPVRYMCTICTKGLCAHFAAAETLDSTEYGQIWQLADEPKIQLCADPASCSCICTLGNFHDVAQKTASIIGGVGLLVGSVAATALTAGAAAPILVPVLVASGIGGGIGVASATHGITQSVKKERINGRDYGIDLGIGGITGLVGTAAVAGAAATGAAAGAALVAHGASTAVVYGVEGATLATAGAVSGVTNHLVSDGIDIAAGRKDEMDFGSGVAVSAITGGVTGAIGAATTQINAAVTAGVADDVVASAAASFAVKGTGKFAEASAKAGTNKALMDEEMEAHDIISTAVTGMISTGVGCAGKAAGGGSKVGPKK